MQAYRRRLTSDDMAVREEAAAVSLKFQSLDISTNC